MSKTKTEKRWFFHSWGGSVALAEQDCQVLKKTVRTDPSRATAFHETRPIHLAFETKQAALDAICETLKFRIEAAEIELGGLKKQLAEWENQA